MADESKTTRREIMPEYREELLGLPYPVILKNGVIRKFDAAGETLGHTIPNLEGMVAAVAIVRARMPIKLLPEEIRFMRKAVDMRAKAFAGAIGVDPATYSRWENGSQAIGEHVERILRIFVCGTLAARAPAIDYDPREIAMMKVLNAWPEGQTPKIELTMIMFKDAITRKKASAWDIDSIAA